MKITKILLAITGLIVATGAQAFADDVRTVFIQNSHGQTNILYRCYDTNLAYYEGGNTVGSAGAATIQNSAADSPYPSIRVINRDTGHGQQIPLFY